MMRLARAAGILLSAATVACGGDDAPLVTPDVDLSVVRSQYKATSDVQSPSWIVRATIRNRGPRVWEFGEGLLLVETIRGAGRAAADSLGIEDLTFDVQRLRTEADSFPSRFASRYVTTFGYWVHPDGRSFVPFSSLNELTGGRGSVSLWVASLSSPKLPIFSGGAFGRVSARSESRFDAEVISPIGPKERGGIVVVLPTLTPTGGVDRAPRHVWYEFAAATLSVGDSLSGGVRHEAPLGAAALTEDVRDQQLPSWRRRFTLNWLVEDHPQEAVPVVVEILNRGEQGSLWRSAVANAGILRTREAVPALVPLLSSEINRGTTILVIEALAQIRDPRALPALRSKLEDEDADIRRTAVVALGSLKDTTSLPDMMAFFRRSTDFPTASAAATAIIKTGSEPGVRELVETLSDPSADEAVRAAVADALTPEMAQRYVEQLAAILSANPPSFLASNVANALGRAGNARAFDVLKAAAEETNAEAARAVIQTLAQSEREEWRDVVINLARSERSRQRGTALYYLGVFEVRKAIPLIQEASGSSDEEVRINACNALEALKVTKPHACAR
ncbi:MAG TPA: HEAT repeat domain-containing protein [Longimicrobium sp.]